MSDNQKAAPLSEKEISEWGQRLEQYPFPYTVERIGTHSYLKGPWGVFHIDLGESLLLGVFLEKMQEDIPRLIATIRDLQQQIKDSRRQADKYFRDGMDYLLNPEKYTQARERMKAAGIKAGPIFPGTTSNENDPTRAPE